jgi:hypothetical protein
MGKEREVNGESERARQMGGVRDKWEWGERERYRRGERENDK